LLILFVLFIFAESPRQRALLKTSK
jgi:hypothetical protein